jgi:hypothetical protein
MTRKMANGVHSPVCRVWNAVSGGGGGRNLLLAGSPCYASLWESCSRLSESRELLVV